MPSAASVQTTIAPSMAVLVRSGSMAIAVDGLGGDTPQRRAEAAFVRADPGSCPDPLRPADGELRRQRAVHADADVDGSSRASGTACPAASMATTSTPVSPVIALSSSQTAWAVASADLADFEMAERGRLLGPLLFPIGQGLGGRIDLHAQVLVPAAKLLVEPPRLEQVPDPEQDLGRIERLREVVVGAARERLVARSAGGVRREHEHGQ